MLTFADCNVPCFKLTSRVSDAARAPHWAPSLSPELAEHASMRNELSWLVMALLSLGSHLLLLLSPIPHAALTTPLDWTTPQSRLCSLALFNNARAFQIPGLCWSYIGLLPRVLQPFCLTYFSSPFFPCPLHSLSGHFVIAD